MVDTEIDRYYSDDFDEIDRLSIDAVGRLERERTKELLLRFLPPAPARVLDVGGGPGVYASWLATIGYDVTLVDPVARHREQARIFGTFAVEDGDARALTAPDASADVVLMLGPLYHLVDPADRSRALAEARRVVRPGGGVIAAAFISRHAPILDVAATLRINDDAMVGHVSRLRNTGANDPGTGFTVAYFHRLEEIRADFAAAGLDEPSVYGIEGPLLPLIRSGLAEDRPEYFEAAVRAARQVEDEPAMLAANAHLLAVVHTA
ncbi:methyltransferase domain-containing protein [Actinospica sp. MGRD01-02]|uniref:Methyltransferase domain-containing protein n=1 Tax=Actinospica acidithermotolerans TaxID=2828514 RepID=A0A941E9U3_9ACTN|nr:class I SAM-dependent methyltransferase [Actinospica acidithermotolerans]MBR7827631.1 methyltransferase domain-containing protein [Actinospica acidithermotolerans]